MPLGDGTGPAGQGPLTGRGAGRCGGNNVQGYGNGFFGRGFGFARGLGRGLGRGFGNYNQAPYNEASEKSWIETAIDALKNQLQSLEKRRSDLDK
ncbi:hypothetical protein MNBD_BACTEROID07-1822 [hydrothermal vent metagenome]|uniref:Cytoplasmic protein n=1 Tax=hydrothermal vent metagenome TaxID=652676 RepID=A0A3B0UEW8_9ZZZZ